MKKIAFYFVSGLVLLLFAAFFIWARAEKKGHLIIILFAVIFIIFLICGFILTFSDKRKKRKELQEADYYNDEVLGSFIKLKKDAYFKGKILWCGEETELEFPSGSEEENKACIKFARELIENQAEWNKRILDFAAADLIDSANDWNEGENITKEKFKERISLSNIIINSGGNFTFGFYDDEIFGDHSIEITGNIQNGPEGSDIVG